MSWVDEEKAKAQREISVAELICSKEFVGLCSADAKAVARQFYIEDPDINIYWDEEDKKTTAYTDGHTITANAGNPLFRGSGLPREAYLLNKGVICGHELAHILFTNFHAQKVYEEALENGYIWPKQPDADSDKIEKLLSLATDKIKGLAFRHIVHDLGNCLEDGRIEALYSTYVDRAYQAKEGLEMLREKLLDKQPSIKQLEELFDEGKLTKYSALTSIALYFGRTLSLKGELNNKSDFGRFVKKALPSMADYVGSENATSTYEALTELLLLVVDDIDEDIEKKANELKEQMDNGQEESESNSETSSSDDESNDSLSEILAKSIADELAKQEGKTADNSSSASTKGCDSEETQHALDHKKKQMSSKERTDDIDTISDDDGEDVDHSVFNPESKLGYGTGNGIIRYRESREESNFRIDLNELKKKLAENKADNAIETKLKAQYKNIAESVSKDFNELHSREDVDIIRNSPSEQERREYDYLHSEIITPASKMANSLSFLQEPEVDLARGRLYGNVYKVERAFDPTLHHFDDERRFGDPNKLAIGIVIDESGSMAGTRIRIAKLFASILYEFAQQLKTRFGLDVKLNIYGHKYRSNVNLNIYTDAEKPDQNDKYRIMSISSGGANRDGLPIRMAVKRLEEYGDYEKMLFIISDGAPAAPNYSGKAAEADLQDIVSHCEQNGIQLLSCAIGSDKEAIHRIYGDEHFVDITDLDKLPERVMKAIRNRLI